MGWGGDPWTHGARRRPQAGRLRFALRLPQHRLLQLPALVRRSAHEHPARLLPEREFLRHPPPHDGHSTRPASGQARDPVFRFQPRHWNSGHGITTFQTDANEYPVATQYERHHEHLSRRRAHRNEQMAPDAGAGRGGIRRQSDRHRLQPQYRQSDRRRFWARRCFWATCCRNTPSAAARSTARCWPRRIRHRGWIFTASSCTASRRTTSTTTQTATGPVRQSEQPRVLYRPGQHSDVRHRAAAHHGQRGREFAAVAPAARYRVLDHQPVARFIGRQSAANCCYASATIPQRNQHRFHERLVVELQPGSRSTCSTISSPSSRCAAATVTSGAIRCVPSPVPERGRPVRGRAIAAAGRPGGHDIPLPPEAHWSNFDFEGASSSHAYFRTSLYNYQRARMRARYQATPNSLSNAYFLGAEQREPDPGHQLSVPQPRQLPLGDLDAGGLEAHQPDGGLFALHAPFRSQLSRAAGRHRPRSTIIAITATPPPRLSIGAARVLQDDAEAVLWRIAVRFLRQPALQLLPAAGAAHPSR